jgi:outer membrane scaffolding protein for murein synthesis (MipA/OmpV family)
LEVSVAGVHAAVESALSLLSTHEQTSWRAELARTLAYQLDDEPNASNARELRALMKEIADESGVVVKGDLSDDLASRRANRIAAATGS